MAIDRFRTYTPAEPYDKLYQQVQYPAIKDPKDYKITYHAMKLLPDFKKTMDQPSITISRRDIPRGRTMYRPGPGGGERYIGRPHYNWYRRIQRVQRQGERFNFGMYQYEV